MSHDAELLDNVCRTLKLHGYAASRVVLPSGLTVDIQQVPEVLSPGERKALAKDDSDSRPNRALRDLGLPLR